jgi:hypothetical protein
LPSDSQSNLSTGTTQPESDGIRHALRRNPRDGMVCLSEGHQAGPLQPCHGQDIPGGKGVQVQGVPPPKQLFVAVGSRDYGGSQLEGTDL